MSLARAIDWPLTKIASTTRSYSQFKDFSRHLVASDLTDAAPLGLVFL